MSEVFQDRVVLITGGSKGIGRETGRLFLDAGFRLVITGRDAAALDRAADDLGKDRRDRILMLPGDVSVEADCRRWIEQTVSHFGRLDILINNAGMSARGVFAETDLGVYRRLTGINFLGPVMMSRLALDQIRKNRGSILFVSTLAALKGLPGLSHYGASKLPLTAFSEALRGELGPQGVHIGLVYVGFTENDDGKTIYDAQGRRIVLEKRKNSLTQQDVARAIFRMVDRRQPVVVLSMLGKLAALAYRLIPRISETLTARGTMKNPRYGKH